MEQLICLTCYFSSEFCGDPLGDGERGCLFKVIAFLCFALFCCVHTLMKFAYGQLGCPLSRLRERDGEREG